MGSVQCSIIIRCFNEERHIGRLLHGITQQTIRDVEIIIVDSGSTDGTIVIANRYPTKILSVRQEDFSFGHSLNVGCQAAAGEFVVIASGHVYPVYRDWLERLLRPLKDPKIALVYGKQRGAKTTTFSEHQVFARWFTERSNFKQDHPFCNNANAAIRRELWKQIPYDEKLTGLEDIDWAKRVMQLGFRIAYVADAEVVHIHNETPSQTCNRYRREAIALKTIYPDERFHFGDFLRLFFTNVISDYGNALQNGQYGQRWVEIPRFRLMQFWGTYRGFAQHGPITTDLKKTFYYPNRLSGKRRTKPLRSESRPLVDYVTVERLYRDQP